MKIGDIVEYLHEYPIALRFANDYHCLVTRTDNGYEAIPINPDEDIWAVRFKEKFIEKDLTIKEAINRILVGSKEFTGSVEFEVNA